MRYSVGSFGAEGRTGPSPKAKTNKKVQRPDMWFHVLRECTTNCKENMILLEKILEHYNYLNNKYCFQSITMSELSKELNAK